MLILNSSFGPVCEQRVQMRPIEPYTQDNSDKDSFSRSLMMMFSIQICQYLTVLCFLVPHIFCSPSITARDFNGLNLFPYGTVKIPSTGHLEIRGIIQGRKKKYIFKREEPGRACCREKLCLSLLGEILDRDCKCQKCSTRQFIQQNTVIHES